MAWGNTKRLERGGLWEGQWPSTYTAKNQCVASTSFRLPATGKCELDYQETSELRTYQQASVRISDNEHLDDIKMVSEESFGIMR
jgi:hypothetical protein